MRRPECRRRGAQACGRAINTAAVANRFGPAIACTRRREQKAGAHACSIGLCNCSRCIRVVGCTGPAGKACRSRAHATGTKESDEPTRTRTTHRRSKARACVPGSVVSGPLESYPEENSLTVEQTEDVEQEQAP